MSVQPSRKTCPHCGERLTVAKPKTRKRTRTRAIALAGRVPAEQGRWYDEAMRVKVGKLVWSPLLNAGRFGARGGYVTPEVAAELEAKAGRPQGPTSRVEDLLNAEQDGETVDWRPLNPYVWKPREQVAA